jgi:anti-anti-sigma regulatory factor
MSEPLDIRTDRTGSGVWIVALFGEHDLSSVHRLENELESMAVTGTGVVVDLSEATFITGAILATLVRHRSPQLAVVLPVSGPVVRLADVTRLHDKVATYRSRVVACRAVAPKARLLKLKRRTPPPDAG